MSIKLNLGCGKRNFGEDWVHIDGSKYDHIHSHNIVNLPFEEESVDLIYASHVFEYFDREDAADVLKKWYGKLKKGGVLRLAVPDFEAYSNLYQRGTLNLDKFLGPLYGKWQMTKKETIYHKTVYDYKSLKTLLVNNNFSNVKLWDWREVEHGRYDDYSQAYVPHMDKNDGVLVSLNVECNK
jgi:predicted SAM-dependent methyltransferase